jgi:hypothetical protein
VAVSTRAVVSPLARLAGIKSSDLFHRATAKALIVTQIRSLKFHALFAASFALAACATATQDAEVAKSAKTRLIGLSELQLETCLGLPDQKLTKGKTTLFTYNANSASNLSISAPIVSGVGVAFAGYCHATFRLESGRVTEIHYSGQTDDMGNKDAVCGPIVRSCVEQ